MTLLPPPFSRRVPSISFARAHRPAFRVTSPASTPPRFPTPQIPEIVDFGYGAVNELMQKDFTFTNDGEVAVDFAWKVNPPFTFEPTTGHLEPGESARVHCEFTPVDATVNVCNAVCSVQPAHDFHDGMKPLGTRVNAVGKYPFVRLSDKDLDFGEVLVGKTVEMSVKLLNQSVVPVTYACERVEAEHDHVFRVGARGGTLDREAHDVIRVQYTPAMPGTFTTESFRFTTPGGRSDTVLRLSGTAVGPSVSLSSTTLNFGSVVSGNSARRTFDVLNQSDVPCHWQIDSEKLGTFALDRDRGIIKPKESQRVLVTFNPTEAANYHRRLTVVFRDGAPLAVDVVGTCYDEKRRPAPMYLSHVESYRARCAVGLLEPGQPPMASDREPFEDEVAMCRAGAMNNAEAFASLFEPDPFLAVSLDAREVDFGACSRNRAVETKTVTVTNNSRAKMTVFWGGQDQSRVADDLDDARIARAAAAAEKNPFSVFPEQADVRPGQSQEFRVSFRPTKDHAYYFRQLECFAYVKSMRSFRQVTEENFTPPWTCAVRALGHTFGHVGATIGFMPKCHFTARGHRLLFPPTVKGDYSYQTLALVNDGDTAVGFEFPSKRVSDVAIELGGSPFSCFPTKGVVDPRSFTLVTFRFDARDVEAHREILTCALNGSTENAVALDVRAQGHVPKLKVGFDNSFVFKPTCVGAVTARDVDVTNLSRINVLYEWDIPEKLASTIAVEPHAGMIRGGETITSKWTFCPQQIKRLGLKIPCVLRIPNSYVRETTGAGGMTRASTPASAYGAASRPEDERVAVAVVAEGTSGAITMRPESMDFGVSVVDHSETRTVELVNQSSGVVRYRLEVLWDEGCSEFDADVRFDEPTGLIPARAAKPVAVRFTGRTRADVGFKIACHTVVTPTLGPSGSSRSLLSLRDQSSSSTAFDGSGGDPPPCVPATATADYPTLRVTDVACEGASKPSLWKQLSVNALNEQLARAPTNAETRMQQTGGLDGSFSSSSALRPLAGVATGLGVGLEGAEPTALYLEVCNVGAIPVEWRLLLRNEPEVDLENWVEIGEPASEVDAHQRFVLEQKIISVSPKFGALEPGQRQPVRVLYRHDHPGAHWLTALLSIKDGRSVRLELGGRTVPLETRCLDFGPANPSVAVHTLRPVVIGDLEPPAQTVELRNPSAAEVRYAIDLTKVEDLNADAWDFPVLTCVERAGTIPAFGTALVNFVFQPVEEKTYECEIGVSLEGGETSSLTIRGAGVLPEEFGGRPVEPDLLGDVARNTGEWIGYAPEPTLPPVGDFQLSSHACVFGDVPALSVTRRVVLLRSQSEADYDFVWDLGPFASDGVDGELVVEPASGRLDRGETVVCKVTFRARDKPQVFDGRVLCLLTPVSPSKEERAEEARLAEEELHAPEVFAEHSSQVWPSMPTRRELEGGTEIWGKIAAHGEESQRMSVVHAATVSSAARWPELAESGARNHAKTIPEVPPPPGDAQLALAVEGRVVPETKFRAERGDDEYARHFIPTFRPDPPEDASASGALADDEMQTLIQGLLHDTLSDPRVRRGFEALERETVPLYLATTGGGAPAETLTRRDEATAGSTIAPESTIAADDWRSATSGVGGSAASDADGAGDGGIRRSTGSEADDEPLPDELPDVPDEDPSGALPSAVPSVVGGALSAVPSAANSRGGSKAPSVVGEPSAGVGFGSAAGWATGDETGMPSDVDPAEIARAQTNPEFREIAEWTMEATLFNLVKELHAQQTEEEVYDEAVDSAAEWDTEFEEDEA